MSIHYRLEPPFLHAPEEQDFSKVWEYFCCKILNLSNRTSEIYIRNPPEQGIDIYYPSKKIAYQCKSVESGKTGDFNVTHAVASIEAAKRAKETVAWERYALCTNVAISGSAEAILRKSFPDIEILPNSHWVQMCEKYPVEIERNFRMLVDLPKSKVLSAINRKFIELYSCELIKKIDKSSFDIFFYSNRHDTVYRMPVSEDFTCSDILNVFREFFKLPESKSINSEGIKISLSHSIVFNGKRLPLSNSLKEAGVSSGSIITYWTTIIWEDAEKKFTSNEINLMTMNRMVEFKSLTQRRDQAIFEFSSIMKKLFEEFDGNMT